MSIYIRTEGSGDAIALHSLITAAFARADEANLVERLRAVPESASFVAVKAEPDGESIVGHVFYSPVEIAGCAARVLGLAPLAVRPDSQRQGIGSQLVGQSLDAIAQLGCQAVVVLGAPAYYSRFGFTPASALGLRCEYDVPEEAFMALELTRGALERCQGTVKYRPEFGGLT
jgi:putative acetyltransferase